MQDRNIGNIGDFGKFALLRHVREGRRLAVCWYRTSEGREVPRSQSYFAYLQRPDEFRHLAPAIFDQLRSIVIDNQDRPSGIVALEASGLLGDCRFHHEELPASRRLRRKWRERLIQTVEDADLILLDPDNGIEGTRLTARHAALSEIAALRRQGRTLMIMQQQTGRRSEVRFITERLRSLGCEPIEIVRFRLVSSQFCAIADHDQTISERIATFSRKWGDWVESYRF
jgi:hypothetical protein